ncbi:MAG: thioredoxin-dependent thiol peroxidase [Verrucomicrobiae bacterium]|nr:thioredoxin-dependent thiol peroxidase [Verrucomicrobiae bacterium]
MAFNPAVGVGDPAPDFTAQDQHGRTLRLSQLRGQVVVLYFYPKDDTPGCTTEACAFRDEHTALQQAGAVVLGVSTDSAASHDKFARKYNLPFSLLADEDRHIVQAYGVWGKKTFMGREYEGTHRVTFLIGPDGLVRRVWTEVKPATHAAEVLAAVRDLAAAKSAPRQA